ncbi:ATP-dependent DNA helicase [Bengtsoniella intestinalis]|uniref:ATP-dependent DNA helicase n=1 Tax=Bengtsoniella intestinalis TaxID=3073143 RepID=UPI00391F89CF
MEQQKIAHDEIDYIFETLLPRVGLALRPAQVLLSHTMLGAMLGDEIALCDAGTGSGKTYAYLVAGIAFHRYRKALQLPQLPIVISTASIALQTAIAQDYLPLLSQVLIADGLEQAPLESIIRKGKSHYVCDERLENRLAFLNHKKKHPATLETLQTLEHNLDMSSLPTLPAFERAQIGVPKECHCDKQICRYRLFLERAQSNDFHFQICNHNLLLADGLHHSWGRRPILPRYCTAILDEAHKLPETARQMLRVQLSGSDIRALVRTLRYDRCVRWADEINRLFTPLLDLLDQTGLFEFEVYQTMLIRPHRVLNHCEGEMKRTTSVTTARKISFLLEAVSLLVRNSDNILYYSTKEEGITVLCATSLNLGDQLDDIFWQRYQPMVLTSGTLAVGDDFSHFQSLVGLTDNQRVVESISPSPFDYGENCMLYISEEPISLIAKDYITQLSDQIEELIQLSHGHALVLFTSYSAMAGTYHALKAKKPPYPLFALGRNGGHTLDQFRATPGAVLFATGSAWEGMDFPGDCVSLLIIPRLPFPFPDALKEREKEQYPTLQEFIQSAVIPEMQMKLRQGFGRAIRTESDTCVVAILDERATAEGRYHHEVLTALPDIPVTDQDWQIEAFLRRTKEDGYFEEERL